MIDNPMEQKLAAIHLSRNSLDISTTRYLTTYAINLTN